MRQSYAINFVCRESKSNKKTGLAPIEMSVSVNNERVFITLPRKEVPSEFRKRMDSRKGNETKTFCQSCYSIVQTKVSELLQLGKAVTAHSVKDAYLGNLVKEYRVSDLFRDFLNVNRCRVGVNLSMSVWRKYQLVGELFIGVNGDIDVGEIVNSHILSYQNKVFAMFKESTVQGYMRKLKTVVKYGLDNHKIFDDPFKGIKIKAVETDVQFLDENELSSIENLDCSSSPCLSRVRDLFLFQCYTGLAYGDMANFDKDRCVEYNGGYILTNCRVKTGVKYTVFLFSKAIAILDRYEWKLPIISNQKYNLQLKVIKDWCRISKPVHSHIARHTAATLFLNKGLGIDVVARILGHSNTSMTKHYAKLLDKTVADEVIKHLVM